MGWHKIIDNNRIASFQPLAKWAKGIFNYFEVIVLVRIAGNAAAGGDGDCSSGVRCLPPSIQ